MFFGCSKKPSHWDDSFEYPQHMVWLRYKKKIILEAYALLTKGLAKMFHRLGVTSIQKVNMINAINWKWSNSHASALYPKESVNNCSVMLGR